MHGMELSYRRDMRRKPIGQAFARRELAHHPSTRRSWRWQNPSIRAVRCRRNASGGGLSDVEGRICRDRRKIDARAPRSRSLEELLDRRCQRPMQQEYLLAAREQARRDRAGWSALRPYRPGEACPPRPSPAGTARTARLCPPHKCSNRSSISRSAHRRVDRARTERLSAVAVRCDFGPFNAASRP